MDFKALKVSEVNNYIKRVLQNDMILSNISVEGEISNFKHHYSGHMYFSLKDEKSRIKAIMFKGDNQALDFVPEEGKKVQATGYISVYEKDGEYQLYVRYMKEAGLGDLYLAFEKLKKKLDEEGLFSPDYKKDIPFMPKKIGVVTSSTGAAIRDIITVIKRRFPPCHILIYPSLVQGENAPKEIIRGLKYLDQREDVDLIITGRGGGSMEELFAFNDEELARTIFAMTTPVISAVGHEIDFTICDFVADLRAATTSAAAELSVPNGLDLKRELDSKIRQYNPLYNLRYKKQDLDSLLRDLDYSFREKINIYKNDLIKIKGSLDLKNPKLGLDKGLGLILDEKGQRVRSIDQVSLGDKISIVLKDGSIYSKVEGKEGGL